MDNFPKIGKQSGYFDTSIKENTNATSTGERQSYSPIRINNYSFRGKTLNLN
mgnify:FL=1